MEVVGNAILSASLDSLIRMLTSPELLKLAHKEKVDKELEKLESKLSIISAVLNDAEDKQVTERAVKIWIAKLRDLVYDTEDVLDEFQTEALVSKSKGAKSQACTSRMPKLLPLCFTALHPMHHMKIGSKLQWITTRFEEIAKEKNDLGLVANAEEGSKKLNERESTTSLVKGPKIYGREKDKEAILKMLISTQPSDTPYSVIPITGMGGVGKTTLAQLVYNDEAVKFDYKTWVCVSDDYDVLKITKTILQGESFGANDLNSLQVKLKEKLSGKKFLIVLDDVWNEKYEKWTALCSPFAAGAPGSKIIVTTRNEDVSSIMTLEPAYKLKGLSEEKCLSLFAQCALDAESFDAYPHLNEVGRKIVERCQGLPLAAKTLGGLLRSKQSLEEWEAVLCSRLWDLPKEKSDILPALRLSYHYLPCHLKQCFAYCAIIPRHYEFEANEVVSLWMAEGLLEQPWKKQKAERLGHEYFHDLLSRSFFQESSSNESQYVMHDLMSDLAQFISGEFCFQLDDEPNNAESYAKVRHSSFTCHEYDTSLRFKVFYKMESLRAFMAFPASLSGCYYLSSKVLDELVPKLKCLRALSLAHYALKELPRSIGALKQLRYLNLSYTSIVRLPESLGKLLNLQTLKLCGCRSLLELPACIGNLINLQCLDVSDSDLLQEMPPAISKLKNLRMLPKFIVGEGSGLGIRQLMKLAHLQGKLHITGLHNIANVHDAKMANLKEKQGLTELALEWSNVFHDARDESHELQVLNSLQPHRSVEMISITSYGSTVFPPWVGDSSLSKLVNLRLCNCHKIAPLLSFRKYPVLRHLSIEGLHGVKRVDVEEFPSLKTLYISNMLEWEKWSWSNGPNDDLAGKFPNLLELTLQNCPNLVGKWPSFLPLLEKLHICNCPQLAHLPENLPSLYELIVEYCQEVIFRSVPNLTSLTNLKITAISGLASLNEAFVQALVALENLQIDYCNELKCLWQDGTNLDKLVNLRHLEISHCDQLGSLVDGEEGLLPCNLQVLQIRWLANLEKLPNRLHSLTSLRELEIWSCKKLVSFPEGASLPCNLKRLDVIGCDSLEMLPDGMATMINDNNSSQSLLEELRLEDCPALKPFPRGKLPTALKSLEITSEKLTSLEDIMEMSYSHLEDLKIRGLSIMSFPTGEFPASLKTLKLYHCEIQSLPSLHSLSHLTELLISRCGELESFPEEGLPLPSLVKFDIYHCEKLRSLPNHMDKLVSLQHLEIRNCGNLSQPMSEWELATLTSLKKLEIDGPIPGITDLDHFPDDDGLLLPTSLMGLRIKGHKNLKSISRGLQHLTSLVELWFVNCSNLQFLPKEGFPASLGFLYISSCPLVKEGRLEENGSYWPIIAHIPLVRAGLERDK